LHDAHNFVRYGNMLFLYHLVIFDNIKMSIWGNKRYLIDLIRFKKFVSHLNNSLLAIFLTVEVSPESNLIWNPVEFQYGYYIKKWSLRIIVYYSSGLYCAYLKLFLI